MKNTKTSLALFICVSVFSAFTSPAEAANSIKRNAITWTFDKDYETGTFANGDPWVKESTLGSGVTITMIDPMPVSGTRYKNGSMINIVPRTGQGYDSAGGAYKPELRAFPDPENDFPKTVPANSSIVSTIGIEPPDDRPSLSDASVLTILPANVTPETGDFRPPYVGTDKSLNWNVRDILWERLPSLPPPSGGNVASLASHSDETERLWLLHMHTSEGRSIHPANNMKEYGRDLSKQLQSAMLRSLLDDPIGNKEELVINLLQKGIDIYGHIENGMTYPPNGGHNQGMKAPMLYTGWLLDDQNILFHCDRENTNVFQEDRSTFYVSQKEVDLTNGGGYWKPDERGGDAEAYTTSDIGMPEWGIRHETHPHMDNRNWGAIYRDVTGSATVGHALVISLLGIEEIWNNPAFFEYYRTRYYPKMIAGKAYFMPNMWDAYVDYITPEETKVRKPHFNPVAGTYETNDTTLDIRIYTTTSNASIYFTTDGSTPSSDSQLYTDSIQLTNGTTTLKTIAFKDGLETSEITEATYTITEQTGNTSTPTADTLSGTYTDSIQVNLSSTTTDATIFYTLDGSTPTTSSTIYTNAISISKSTQIKAFAISTGLNASSISDFQYTINQTNTQTASPSISPSGGEFLLSLGQTVELASTTPEATIYYTLDGSPPSKSSIQYTEPIKFFDETTVRAIATADGLTDSAESNMSFSPGILTSNNGWQNVPIQALANLSSATLKVTPLGNNIDSVVGLSYGQSNAFSDLALIVRFNSSGYIDVRNGSTYSAITLVSYRENQEYTFRFNIDIGNALYDVYLYGSEGETTIIADNYAFRTENSHINTINHLSHNTISGTGHTINDFTTSTVAGTKPIAPSSLIIHDQQ